MDTRRIHMPRYACLQNMLRCAGAMKRERMHIHARNGLQVVGRACLVAMHACMHGCMVLADGLTDRETHAWPKAPVLNATYFMAHPPGRYMCTCHRLAIGRAAHARTPVEAFQSIAL